VACVKTLYEHAGGDAALHRAEEIFYDKVLADPVLKAQFLGECNPRRPSDLVHRRIVGGPDRFTQQLGFQYIIDVHRHRKITDEQRQRFVALYLEAIDEAGLPTDEPFRDAVRSTSSSARVSHSKTPGRHRRRASPDPYRPHWSWPE
jgi:hemoglobin